MLYGPAIMKRKLLSVSLALVLLSAATPVALTQTQANNGPQDWQGLKSVKLHTMILIEFKAGKRDPTLAEFFMIDDDSLYVLQDGVRFRVFQRDIQRVSLPDKWSRRNMAKAGAAVGVVAGLFVGIKVMVDQESSHPRGDAAPAPAVGGMLIGGLAGAGVGALIGKRRGKLLYEAK